MATPWRKAPNVNLPDIEEDKAGVIPNELTIKVDGPWGTLDVFYLEGSPVSNSPRRNTSVLLLHGMRFSSATWRDLGTIEILCALGFRVVAVDLPGYGKTQGQQLKGDLAAQFLGKFMASTNLTNPVVVSPSMSGSYSLPYIFQETNRPSIKGYVPIAPIETENYTVEQYGKYHFPVLIVYGENDTILGEQSLKNLSGFMNKEVVCFENAGHVCYMDNPPKWHMCIYNFLINID